MSKHFCRPSRSGLVGMLLALGLTLLSIGSVQAQTTLSDSPLYSASNVPANLMLALSVEFPTGTVAAYGDAEGYSPTQTYLGYFDSAKCYDYSSTTLPDAPANGYFVPVSVSTTCGSNKHWSGNMLNWALMTSLDEFRQALTGGNRVVDTTTSTVLLRSNLNSQSNTSNDPDRHIGSTVNVNPNTVIGDPAYASLSDIYIEVAGQGTQFVISNNSTFVNDTTGGGKGGGKGGKGAIVNKATTYNAEVQVCVSGLEESNCNDNSANTYIGSGKYAKPEGLIQQSYTKIRVGASAYAFKSGNGPANGTVRALLRDNGPTTYNGYGARQTNKNTEWDSATGIFDPDPDSTAKDSSTAQDVLTAPGGVNATQTGAINYLNQFGYANGYETYDTMADLYWATLAYYMHLPLDASYTAGLTSGNSLDTGFPAFTTQAQLNDPIQYSCQSNAIVSIGDAHTWYETHVPSSPGPAPNSANQAVLDVVGGADAAAYTTKLGNLPLIEQNGATPASITMAQMRQAGSSATTATVVATPLGQQSEPNGTKVSTYNMAGLAYFAHTQDIRPDASLPNAQTVSTYAVDVLEPGAYAAQYYNPGGFNTSGSNTNPGPDTYWLAAKYGGFNNINNDGVPANILTWHTNSSSGDTLHPDNYFPGNRPDLLQAGLKQIFNNIASTASQNAGAPATLTTRVLNNITAGATVAPYFSPVAGFPAYTSQYTPVSWTGDLAGNIATGVAGGSVTTVAGGNPWHAQIQLDTLTQTKVSTKFGWDTGRRIVTWNGVKGVPFRYLSLSASEQSTLSTGSPGTGADVLNYLRGDKSNETTDFRARTHILGDLVNSSPVLVQEALAPSYTEAANPGYPTFKTSVANRAPVVYVGANDGMLHAFAADFSKPTVPNPVTGGGSELFAYVPSFTFNGPSATPQINGIAALANLDGVSTNPYKHHFYVDSTPQVGDVDFTFTSDGTVAPSSTSATSAWHSVLLGGLGKGGKGYYALDITSVPAAVDLSSSTTAETSEAQKVLWEFTDADMGYSYGAPLIVKTRKYGWVAVMTSGYNNTGTGQDGHGVLYVVNIQTGALLQKIDTGAGSLTAPDGLAQATAFTQDVSDGTIDQVYAGDLLGNVWRFDLSEGILDSSGQPTGNYPAPALLATLKDGSGNSQPITTAPRIEESISGLQTLRWVFVGTGQFLDITDLTNTGTQTMYALRDGTGSTPSAAATALTRSKLTAVTDLLTGVNIPDTASGWYYDLTGSAGTNGGTERIVINPDAASGVSIIAWTTLTPSSDPCSLKGAIYATSFSGQSQLVGSNKSVTSFLTTDSATTGIQIVQLPGTTQFSLLHSETGGTLKTDQLQQNPNPNSLFRTNWREILQ
jgi:type IV pilus assembly protein PilY1